MEGHIEGQKAANAPSKQTVEACAGASLVEVVVQCSLYADATLDCERLEDFIALDENDVTANDDTILGPEVKSMADQLRLALEEQSERLMSLHAHRVNHLTNSWQARIAHKQSSMAKERADTQRKLTMLH